MRSGFSPHIESQFASSAKAGRRPSCRAVLAVIAVSSFRNSSHAGAWGPALLGERACRQNQQHKKFLPQDFAGMHRCKLPRYRLLLWSVWLAVNGMDERHVLILRASPFRTIFRFALKGTSLRAPAKQSRGHENNSGLLRRFAPSNDDLTAVLRCPLASRRGVIGPTTGQISCAAHGIACLPCANCPSCQFVATRRHCR